MQLSVRHDTTDALHHTTVTCIDFSIGLIKSPVNTTALQVVTRVIQVWLIWYTFPGSTAASHAYLALILAWSLADAIRYFYLALNLHGKAPKALVWLRYVGLTPRNPIYGLWTDRAQVHNVLSPVPSWYWSRMVAILSSYRSRKRD